MASLISPLESTPNTGGFTINVDVSSQDNKNKQGKNSSASGQISNFSHQLQDTLTLSPEAQQKVRELQQRDAEVRAHEQAHVAGGGGHVQGGIQYAYTTGPDKKQYATGGSVSIDTSPVPGDPEATIEKARAVRSAALAPSSPSAQDHSVAAAAATMEAEAQSEKSQDAFEAQGRSFSTDPAPTQEETRRIPNVNQPDMASVAALYARNVGFATYLENAHNQAFTPSSSAVPSTQAVHTAKEVNETASLFSTSRATSGATVSAQAASSAYSIQAERAAWATALAPVGKWAGGVDIHV